jgi:predicted solute-binding protein
MSSKTFIFMTFTFEVVYSSKMLFQVVIFEIQILNHSKKLTRQDDQNKSFTS